MVEQTPTGEKCVRAQFGNTHGVLVWRLIHLVHVIDNFRSDLTGGVC